MVVKKKGKRVRAKRVIPKVALEPSPEESSVEAFQWEKAEPLEEVLPPDLQAPINREELSPQMRAKMVRYAFGVRGWPNAEHEGTVRSFLEEHNIPII
tara:strand:+ start:1461 stop:1754 length:294 start_codon:yes stop_codon:yes gene_type:complete